MTRPMGTLGVTLALLVLPSFASAEAGLRTLREDPALSGDTLTADRVQGADIADGYYRVVLLADGSQVQMFSENQGVLVGADGSTTALDADGIAAALRNGEIQQAGLLSMPKTFKGDPVVAPPAGAQPPSGGRGFGPLAMAGGIAAIAAIIARKNKNDDKGKDTDTDDDDDCPLGGCDDDDDGDCLGDNCDDDDDVDEDCPFGGCDDDDDGDCLGDNCDDDDDVDEDCPGGHCDDDDDDDGCVGPNGVPLPPGSPGCVDVCTGSQCDDDDDPPVTATNPLANPADNSEYFAQRDRGVSQDDIVAQWADGTADINRAQNFEEDYEAAASASARAWHETHDGIDEAWPPTGDDGIRTYGGLSEEALAGIRESVRAAANAPMAKDPSKYEQDTVV